MMDTHTCSKQSILASLIFKFLGGGRKAEYQKWSQTHTQGETAKSTQKSPSWDSNQGLFTSMSLYILSYPGHGDPKSLSKGNWTSPWFLKTFHLSSEKGFFSSNLVGNTHTIDFVRNIQHLKLSSSETIVSLDMTLLFTCIPNSATVENVSKQLQQDDSLNNRTNFTPDQICVLLDLYVSTTYFENNDRFYRQKHGCGMGSLLSSVVANLFNGGSGKQSPKLIQRNSTTSLVQIRGRHLGQDPNSRSRSFHRAH